MRIKTVALATALCASITLGACAKDLQEEIAEGELPRTPAEGPPIAPSVDGSAAPGPLFEPALDTNRNGVLDPDEGLSDMDGDGVLDRDEPYKG